MFRIQDQWGEVYKVAQTEAEAMFHKDMLNNYFKNDDLFFRIVFFYK